MKEQNEHLDELIGKYLLKEATLAEMDEMEAWLQQSAENRQYFQQMKKLLEKTPAASTERFNTEKAWNKVKAKIEATPQSKSEAKVISINRNKVYFRVAASLAGVLLIAAFLLNRFYLQTEKDILHATNNVVLDTLSGGTIVHLNKNSTLIASYNAHRKSQIVQVSGEAYFEVRKKDGETFVIETQDILIRDIGTSFNVKSDPVGKQIETIVEEGEVVMYSANDPGIHLRAGESGYYDVTTRTFTKAELTDRNALAYKTKKFRFNNIPLSKVVQSVNSVYEKKIVLKGDITECNLTISFDNEDVDSIAELIAETLGLKKTDTPEEILLEGTGCGQ